jgi:hypothetical protein
MGGALARRGGGGEKKGSYWVLVRKPEERDHLQAIGISWRIILKSVFRKWNGGIDWTDVAQDGTGGVLLSGSTKCGKFD